MIFQVYSPTFVSVFMILAMKSLSASKLTSIKYVDLGDI